LTKVIDMVNIIVSIITFLLLLFIGLIVFRSISTSVRTLEEGAQIIGSGNLAHRLNNMKNDELGRVGLMFNEMATQMHHSLLAVKEAANQLTTSSETLSAVAEETTAQTLEVNEAIKQVTSGA